MEETAKQHPTPLKTRRKNNGTMDDLQTEGRRTTASGSDDVRQDGRGKMEDGSIRTR
jgi:hypothetical protein